MDFEKRIAKLEEFLSAGKTDDFYHKQYKFLEEIENSVEGDPSITEESKQEMFQSDYGTEEQFVVDQIQQTKYRNFNH